MPIAYSSRAGVRAAFGRLIRFCDVHEIRCRRTPPACCFGSHDDNSYRLSLRQRDSHFPQVDSRTDCSCVREHRTTRLRPMALTANASGPPDASVREEHAHSSSRLCSLRRHPRACVCAVRVYPVPRKFGHQVSPPRWGRGGQPRLTTSTSRRPPPPTRMFQPPTLFKTLQACFALKLMLSPTPWHNPINCSRRA